MRIYTSIIATFIILALAGCATPHGYQPDGYHCQKIATKLHAGTSRHNAGQKLTAIGEARLMKEYQKYHCGDLSH